MADRPQIIILMGVSGSGKTTVGQALAQLTSWDFFDGDDFHPPGNVAKMASGKPLNDADRAPWLEKLHHFISRRIETHEPAVLAVSALKKSYRELLQSGLIGVSFVFLRGDYQMILQQSFWHIL